MPDQDQLGTLPPYEQIAPRLQSAFPDLHPDAIRQTYEQALQLAAHRQRADQAPSVANNPFVVGMTSSVPFVSPLIQSDLQQRYDSARSRLESGNPQPDDYAAIAVHERMQQDIAQRGVGGRIGAGLAAVPAIAGEVALGGAVGRAAGLGARAAGWLGAAAPNIIRTPEAARQVAEARGAQSPELRDWAAASGYAGLQTLVYGTAPRLAQAFGIGGGSIATRAAITLGGGLAEQQVADAVGGLMGVPTGYGVIGHMIAGRHGEAWQDAAVQLATLSALFGMHEATRARPPIQQPAPGQGPGIGPATPQGPVPGSQPPGGMPGQPGPSPMPGPAPSGAPGAPPGQVPPSGPQQRLAAAWTEALRRYAATGISSRRAAERITQQINDLLGGRASGAGTRFEGLIELWNQNPHWGRDEAAEHLGLGPQMARSMRDNPARPFFEALLRELPTAAERAGGDEGPLGGQQAQPNVRQTSTPQYPFEPPTIRPNAPPEGITRLHTAADIVHQPPQGGEPGVERSVNAPGSLTTAPEPQTGVTPPQIGQNAPAVTPTPLERIAAMRRRQGMVRTPEQPTQAPKIMRPDAPPADAYDSLHTFGLTPEQQHIVREMGLQDRRRSLRDVMTDKEVSGLFRNKDKPNPETVSNHLDKAIEQINASDPVRAGRIAWDIGEAQSDEAAWRLQHGQGFTAQDVGLMTPEGRQRLGEKLEVEQPRVEKLIREIEADIKKNGPLTAEKAADYEKRYFKSLIKPPKGNKANKAPPAKLPANIAGQPMAGPAEAAPVAETGVANRPGGGGEREGEPPGPTAIADEFAPPTGMGEEGRRGAISIPPEAADMVRGAADEVLRSAGFMVPATTRLDRSAGEAVAHLMGVRVYAHYAGIDMIDKVLGKSTVFDRIRGTAPKTADAVKAGTTMNEWRLRYMKRQYLAETLRHSNEAAGKRAQAASLPSNDPAKAQLLKEAAEHSAQATEFQNRYTAVGSLIGKPGSPLATFADYAASLKSPEIQQVLKNWHDHMVPLQEGLFNRALGLPETDPINSLTQIPGYPISLFQKREGGSGKIISTKLKNLKAKKLGATYQATGAADEYECDLREIITRTIEDRAANAGKAEMIRTMNERGLGKLDVPGQHIEFNGKRAVELPFTNPPKGAQFGGPATGPVSWYVHPDAAEEVRLAMDIDKPIRWETFRLVAGAFNGGMTLGTSEALGHMVNQGTAWFAEGMMTSHGVKSYIFNVYRRVTHEPGLMKRMVELASEAAMKPPGFEGGMIWRARIGGRDWNPLYHLQKWTGKVIDLHGEVMRLTLADVHDKMVREGAAPSTATDRRNFLNTEIGQYQRAGSSKLVRFLKDTGFGVFATAGFNFNLKAVRRMAGGQGLQGTSVASEARLRSTLLAKILAVGAAGILYNIARWGRWDGDDDVPFLAIKTGSQEDGRSLYYDLNRFTGLTRAARLTGAHALAEGMRSGQPKGTTADRMASQVLGSWAHPLVGPPISFGYTAWTGSRPFGPEISQRLTTREVMQGDSQKWRNFQAALWNISPQLGHITGHDERPRRGQAENTLSDRLLTAGGPLGPLAPSISKKSARKPLH